MLQFFLTQSLITIFLQHLERCHTCVFDYLYQELSAICIRAVVLIQIKLYGSVNESRKIWLTLRLRCIYMKSGTG